MPELNRKTPTKLPLADLGDWVIWQFPHPRHGGLCAALHSPEAESGWLPAIIHLKAEQVEIYAHATDPFPTPEEAVAWMEKA